MFLAPAPLGQRTLALVGISSCIARHPGGSKPGSSHNFRLPVTYMLGAARYMLEVGVVFGGALTKARITASVMIKSTRAPDWTVLYLFWRLDGHFQVRLKSPA